MTGTKIYEVSSEQQQELIRWLAPCIPTCIALYRRIQFGHFEPGARVLSSIDFASPAHERNPKEPWIVAYVDRACRPETEVWLAASWEHDTPTDDSYVSHADDLVRAMIKKISQLEIPPKAGVTANPEKATDQSSTTNGSVLADRDQFLSHMQNENIVLFGSVHRATFTILKRLGFIDPNSAEVSGIPYRKYIFDIRNDMVPQNLPSGFEYGKVDAKDYALVKSRTQIPRQDRTLCKLPSVAIYPINTSSSRQEPVAWGFLGLDASLTTLHVEPAYRGLGLAKSLSLKLFSDDMEIYCQHNPTPTGNNNYVGERSAHADVAIDNKASQGVCESLGGKWNFEVFWIRVDLLA